MRGVCRQGGDHSLQNGSAAGEEGHALQARAQRAWTSAAGIEVI